MLDMPYIALVVIVAVVVYKVDGKVEGQKREVAVAAAAATGETEATWRSGLSTQNMMDVSL